jgi:hypothetical protein
MGSRRDYNVHRHTRELAADWRTRVDLDRNLNGIPDRNLDRNLDRYLDRLDKLLEKAPDRVTYDFKFEACQSG